MATDFFSYFSRLLLRINLSILIGLQGLSKITFWGQNIFKTLNLSFFQKQLVFHKKNEIFENTKKDNKTPRSP